jgi:hypothetical protein
LRLFFGEIFSGGFREIVMTILKNFRAVPDRPRLPAVNGEPGNFSDNSPPASLPLPARLSRRAAGKRR